MQLVFDHALASDSSAPARARALLDELMLPAAVKADTALLISELVTNAIRHADAPEGSRVRVRIHASGTQLRVEVQDAGRTDQPLRALTPDPTRAGGMGLMLVSKVASRWGQQHDPVTQVWFELDFGAGQPSLPAQDQPAPAATLRMALPEPPMLTEAVAAVVI